jgi:Tfp pilus assembly protein PilO
MSSASPHKKMIIATLLVGAAMAAALWLLALSPKRAESATVSEKVAAQEARLAEARTELASYQSARKQYPGMLAELKRLDQAVPSRGEITALLRQLQKRAKASKSELQVAALKPGATAPPGAAATKSTPGATPAAGGIATLPFTFTYTGEYFDLVKVLAAARRAVTVKSGDLQIDGRLVTIEGMAFQRAEPDAPLIKATVSATAYIAAAPADPQPPAIPVVDAAEGGS